MSWLVHVRTKSINLKETFEIGDVINGIIGSCSCKSGKVTIKIELEFSE